MTIGRNVPRAGGADASLLQWANGKTVARKSIGAGRFEPLVGWHIEFGKDADLDATLHAGHFDRIEIKHQADGGSRIVQHWYFGEQIVFHPLTAGPPYETVAALVRDAAATAAAGLGVKWAQGERSRLAVRGYARPVLDAGYVLPVQLSTRSRMTDVLLGALLSHFRACEAADDLIDRNKHPEPVAYHEIGLPLEAGEEAEWGKGDTATVIPFRSAHPATIDGPYLRTVWRPEHLHTQALRDWESVLAWAESYATEMEAYA